jgi:hypothetical protein
MADGHDHARRRYLTAKRSVDDRARDRRVRDRLRAALPDRPRVVEAGPGAGFTVAALHEWGHPPADYHGVDAGDRAVAHARYLTPRLLARRGHDATPTAEGCRLADGAEVSFAVGDALDALPGAEADLAVAQSFLDLVPLDRAIPALEAAVAPGGLVYAPLTFDGVTLFRPAHPADDRVIDAFHADIDAAAGRNSRAGRDLLERLSRRDDLLAVGASDWVVRPHGDRYPADERFFLATILGFVADATEGVAGGDDWLATRRAQLAAGELTYVAHGYDLVWRADGA